jgi:hypothetical protein
MKTLFVGTLQSPAGVKFCVWLKSSRKRLRPKVSLRTAGEALKSSHTLPSKIENGNRRIDVVEYVIYCNALGLDPVDGIKVIQDSLEQLDHD